MYDIDIISGGMFVVEACIWERKPYGETSCA